MAPIHDYPADEVIAASNEAKGLTWTARELRIPRTTLQSRCLERGIPTKKLPQQLEASDEMKKIAGLIK